MRLCVTRAVLGSLMAFVLVVPAQAQEEKEWGYNKGFYFRTSQFELKISTRTQFRYTYTMFDENSLTDDNGFFNLPRTRLRLDGFAYYPWLKYKVQYDFTGQVDAGATPSRRSPDLRDLYFDLAAKPWTSVRLGQFKAPLGIQEMTSSGDQEFVDRSVASEAFAPSRQQGAMLWGTSFEKAFGYELGVFNGNSRNRNQNDNTGYMYVARVHWDPNGEYKLSESSLDNPGTPNWTIGAAYMLNDTQADLLKTAEKLGQQTLEGFFGLKYKGLFVLADYYSRSQEQAGGLTDVDSDGAIAQVGYFFIPGKLEVALRWSQVDDNTDVQDEEETEERVGFVYFFSKHDLKLQADYGRIEDEASLTDEKTEVFRAQFQIVF